MRLYDQPRHPYANALLSAVPAPEPGPSGPRERIILVGDVPSPVHPADRVPVPPPVSEGRSRAASREVPILVLGAGDGPDHAAALPLPGPTVRNLAGPALHQREDRIIEPGRCRMEVAREPEPDGL